MRVKGYKEYGKFRELNWFNIKYGIVMLGENEIWVYLLNSIFDFYYVGDIFGKFYGVFDCIFLLLVLYGY